MQFTSHSSLTKGDPLLSIRYNSINLLLHLSIGIRIRLDRVNMPYFAMQQVFVSINRAPLISEAAKSIIFLAIRKPDFLVSAYYGAHSLRSFAFSPLVCSFITENT